MQELTPENLEDYLQDRKLLAPHGTAHAELLAWGVSNMVMRVSGDFKEDILPAQDDLVIKQSRRQLRTQATWYSRLDRIWREADVMRAIEPLLPAGVVPRVLFEDRKNYVMAMSAIDKNHTVWKESLLRGNVDFAIGRQAAIYLGTLHRETANRPDLQETLGNRTVFEELRIEPFYRTIACRYPDLSDSLEQLIEEMLETPVALVLADFSPKNILVTATGISLVDFETGHYGDPAFDLGFFLSHILLKAIFHAPDSQPFLQLAETFLTDYQDKVRETFEWDDLMRRTMGHLAGCLLARIDGTSPVDYLDERQKEVAREFGLQLFRAKITSPQKAIEMLNEWL
ncbi:MAG: aminoglycoside phosphotransferase family protein [Planctomycetaceae bacterium]